MATLRVTLRQTVRPWAIGRGGRMKEGDSDNTASVVQHNMCPHSYPQAAYQQGIL